MTFLNILAGAALGALGGALTVASGGLLAPLVPVMVASGVAGGVAAATTDTVSISVSVPTGAPAPAPTPTPTHTSIPTVPELVSPSLIVSEILNLLPPVSEIPNPPPTVHETVNPPPTVHETVNPSSTPNDVPITYNDSPLENITPPPLPTMTEILMEEFSRPSDPRHSAYVPDNSLPRPAEESLPLPSVSISLGGNGIPTTQYTLDETGIHACVGSSISGPAASVSTCTDVDTGETTHSTCVGTGIVGCVDNKSNVTIGGCVSLPDASVCLQQKIN